MSSAEKLHHLKLIAGAVDITVVRDSFSAPNLPSGVPKGTVVEITGPRKYEWYISFLKQHPELRCFWAERQPQVLPTSLHQRGVNLENITFGILGDDCFVSIRKIIQSQVYPVILTTTPFKELKMLRAFQLLTEKSNTILFLAGSKEVTPAWPISLQLHIARGANGFQINVLKQKYGTAP